MDSDQQIFQDVLSGETVKSAGAKQGICHVSAGSAFKRVKKDLLELCVIDKKKCYLDDNIGLMRQHAIYWQQAFNQLNQMPHHVILANRHQRSSNNGFRKSGVVL